MTLISITPSDLVNTLARGDIDDFSWSLKAVEAVDRNIGKIIDAADKADYSYMIVSDHGNCEEMRDAAGNVLTNHTVGDVFCFVKANGVDAIRSGGLSNVAPTILKIMGLPIPSEMDEPLF